MLLKGHLENFPTIKLFPVKIFSPSGGPWLGGSAARSPPGAAAQHPRRLRA